ncbi:MAG: cation transporter [Bacteroidales bacterium]|nr:cation transporter [Bacteroidales bacterium]MDD6052750.1 cation diffusion facilitator family transporter [Bacteroidales bacterium]
MKENREKAIRRVTVLGAAVNTMLTAIKILAGIFGRSAAMVADGVHSLSDLLSDFVVLVFTHISSKGRDKGHSFGHGKFETLATSLVSLLLIVVGAKMMASGIESIIAVFSGEVLPRPGYIALAAALISIVAKEIIYRMTAKVGEDYGSQVVIANAWHHRSDALSSIGSLLGIGGAIVLGEKWTVLDPIVSCCISVAIIIVALKIGMPALSELLDASLPEAVEAEIVRIAESVDGVMDIHDLKTRKNGVSVIIEAHILVDASLSIVEAHDVSSRVEDALTARFGPETQVSIHVEPKL